MSRDLDAIIEVMCRVHCRDISLYDEAFLAKSADKRMAATGIRTLAAYGEALSDDHTEAEALFFSLRIAYSEFFRNPLTFAVLEQLVLPALIAANNKAGRTEIRVWSAACSAGQEAYSMAILLEEAASAPARPVPFRIFATDISEVELSAAREGVYDFAAVQNVPLKHIQERFTRQGDRYRVFPRLKEFIDFSIFDLLDESSSCPPSSIYGDFDLVLCSNLLFYYRADVRRLILDKVCRALSPEGYLVTGEAEREIVSGHKGFRAVAPPAAVFRKIKARG
jgi:chemotaxis protein methyltransferase CheR